MCTHAMNYDLLDVSVYVFGAMRPVQFNYGRWINFFKPPTRVDISTQPCILFPSNGGRGEVGLDTYRVQPNRSPVPGQWGSVIDYLRYLRIEFVCIWIAYEEKGGETKVKLT